MYKNLVPQWETDERNTYIRREGNIWGIRWLPADLGDEDWLYRENLIETHKLTAVLPEDKKSL